MESFGAFAGWQTAALKANRKPLLWPWPGALGACGLGPGVRVAEGVWRVLEGVWRVMVLERLESFGAFAGWQTAALKANRKPLLWPWPTALAPGCLFEKWPWPWGACGGRCLEGLEGVWRV